jgi:hypothetical protein
MSRISKFLKKIFGHLRFNFFYYFKEFVIIGHAGGDPVHNCENEHLLDKNVKFFKISKKSFHIFFQNPTFQKLKKINFLIFFLNFQKFPNFLKKFKKNLWTPTI